MLTSLRVENFAIVSELELDFSTGMTAFTGETGAGKSIMIDALMLALGERADASVIRRNKENCTVSASFHIDKASPPAQWLTMHDIPLDDDEVILRRVIYTEGRSKSYINGQPFPLQKVKELSEMLVDIHGQHQHQTLLQHATHRVQLDQYAKHSDLVDNVAQLYHECQTIKQALQALEQLGNNPDQKNLLEQQILELEQLQIQPNEMQSLHIEHQLLHHARDYIEQTQQISARLKSDDEPNICQSLSQILRHLTSFPQEHPSIRTTEELINSALIQCEEAYREIAQFSDEIQLDPERLQAIEERLSTLHQTARKYHVDVNQLPEHALRLKQQLESLTTRDSEKLTLERQYEERQKAYEKAALLLRASRQKHGALLAEEITSSIQDLSMPKGYLTIQITPLDKMHAHGLDKVEYIVCTNPGMPPDSLAKIASGGELSRIGLAIHVITAKRGATPTLLFDEVDVGIGGATAALVGQLLRKLGERLQVFCVTHQPQVASSAHHHFLVEKHCEQDQTFSRIIALSGSEKIDEIARMLGGLTITEQSRSHARELLGTV